MGEITRENYDEVKKQYGQAISDGKDTFTFEGQEVLTTYAKYVVQYIENTH